MPTASIFDSLKSPIFVKILRNEKLQDIKNERKLCFKQPSQDRVEGK